MTRKQMLSMVRKLIADEQATGFTEGGNLEEPEGTQELENYLNRAVDEYSKRRANEGDIRLMKEAEITDGGELPGDYLSFCGLIPVKVVGKKVKYYRPDTRPMAVRYMGRLDYVTEYEEDEELPYEEDQQIAISALVAIYALNKQEMPITQHLLLMGYGNGNVEGKQ